MIVSKVNQRIIYNKCKRDMLPYRNSQSGRCFIVGNGPSLTIDDLELINNEVTFASNRIYSIFLMTSWRPTYYAVQDDGVILELRNKFYDISFQVGTMFISGNQMRKYERRLINKKNVKFMYIKNTPTGKIQFDADVLDGIHNGINISYTMIELAIYMGYREIYLIGVDHNYKTTINEKGEDVIDGNCNSNYFSGISPLKYESKITMKNGVSWEKERTQCFINAKYYADNNGIKIINATRGGMLDVFERISLEEIILNEQT